MYKNNIKILVILFMMIFSLNITTSNASINAAGNDSPTQSTSKNGWYLEDGHYKYYKDGVMYKNTSHNIENNYFLFNENGWCINFEGSPRRVIIAGWIYQLDGNNTIPSSSEHPVAMSIFEGWHWGSHGWNYFSRSDGETYGRLLVDTWKLIDGRWYYFNNNGFLQEGWLKRNGHTFYFPPSNRDVHSSAAQGRTVINGNTYSFSIVDASMETGFSTTKLKSGHDSQYYYYESGQEARGWVYIDGKWYYFSEDDNAIYSQGQAYIGWFKDDSKVKNGTGQVQWYYFSNDPHTLGQAFTGLHTINSQPHYFNFNGLMQTSSDNHLAFTSSDRFYIANQEGVLYSGLFQYNGNWYYADTTNYYIHRGVFQDINSNTYHSDNITGIIQTGWYNDNGRLYFFSSLPSTYGQALRGYQNVGNNNYYFRLQDSQFGPRSSAYQGWWYDNGYLMHFDERTFARDFYQRADAVQNRWIDLNGQRYYTNPTGTDVLREFHIINDEKGVPYLRHFDTSTGAMTTGALQLNQGQAVYFYPNGIECSDHCPSLPNGLHLVVRNPDGTIREPTNSPSSSQKKNK